MAMLEKTVRTVAGTLAVLFIALSLVGIAGVWWVERKATDVALKAFSIVETAAGVISAGVARVDGLIATSRTEVRQAAETITAVGARVEANSPVLTALGERLETSLAPRIGQMQQALAPVRDAVATIGNAISVANSLPMVADRAPRLAALDEAFNRLEQLSADTTQLRNTLRALAGAQVSQVTTELVATLTGLTQRIDTRLGEVQAGVQEVQADIAAWQVRLDTRKSRLLFVFNLVAFLVSLMLAWIVHSQIVVIRHYRRAAAEATSSSHTDAPSLLPSAEAATRAAWRIVPLPAARADLRFTETYTPEEFERIRRGVIPREMEDKWFVFYEDSWLFFHRSWTGFAIYGVRFRVSDSGASAVESWVSRDPSQYEETRIDEDRARLKRLIDGLLLGKRAAHDDLA
jgi:hypothetical protein